MSWMSIFSVVQLVYKFYLPLARLLCACSSLFPCRVRAYQYSVEIPRLILFLLWDVRLTLPFCSSIPRRRFFYFVQNRIRQKFDNDFQRFFSNFFFSSHESHVYLYLVISTERQRFLNFFFVFNSKFSQQRFHLNEAIASTCPFAFYCTFYSTFAIFAIIRSDSRFLRISFFLNFLKSDSFNLLSNLHFRTIIKFQDSDFSNSFFSIPNFFKSCTSRSKRFQRNEAIASTCPLTFYCTFYSILSQSPL